MPPQFDDQRASPTPTIVPDRNDMTVSRGATRRRHDHGMTGRRRPRVWPLWGLCLLLIAALAAGAWQYRQDRDALEAQIDRLNHRLDTTGSTLDASGESLRAEFDRLRDQLEATRAAVGSLETRVADDRRDGDLAQQVESLQQADENQRALIGALQSSFASLESTGQDERGALSARLETLEEAQQQQGERLDSLAQQSDDRSASIEALQQSQKTLVQRMDDADDQQAAIDELHASVTALQQRVEAVAQQDTSSPETIEQLQSAVTELRQGQTALNAGLESLQSRLDDLPSGVSASEVRELGERIGSLEASRAQLTRRVTSLITDVSNLQRGGG